MHKEFWKVLYFIFTLWLGSINTVVWKYFVAKKFSWVIKPTKIYYTKNFNVNNKRNKAFIYIALVL